MQLPNADRNPPVPTLAAGGTPTWLVWPLTVTTLVVLAYPLFLRIPLFDPDEGLHASIAQEMVERGDWLVPRFQGKPFLDKPILFTWAQALSLRLFGMNAAAARLPGMVFGLLAMVTTGLLGWRMFGSAAGLLAATFYMTLILPTILVQVPVHDVALVPWVNLAILAFWEAERSEARRTRVLATLAAGIVLGLACLTKGLVGVALVGVAYGSYLLVARRLTVRIGGRGLVALLIAGLVAAPWYLAMEARLPGYLHYYFVDRHVLGYVTTTQRHGHCPWWFYLPLVLGGGLPWIAYLPVRIKQWWRDRKETGGACPKKGAILCWCWLLACTLFLSLAHSKLITYLWPVFPPIAILAAIPWSDLLEGRLTEIARHDLSSILRGSCLASPLVLLVTMLVLRSPFHLTFTWWMWFMAILVAVTAWIPAALWATGRLRATVCSMPLVFSLQFAWLMGMVVPGIAVEMSARDLARHFNRVGSLPPQVLIVKERVGSVIFYLTPDLRDRLHRGQFTGIGPGETKEIRHASPGALGVLPETKAKDTPSWVSVAGIPCERVGRYRLYDATTLNARWK